jgi:hypothetical protein
VLKNFGGRREKRLDNHLRPAQSRNGETRLAAKLMACLHITQLHDTKTVSIKNIMQSYLKPFAFLLLATTLEVSGDAIVRVAIYKYAGSTRIGLMLIGAALLLGYGSSLNLAPLEFGQVVGLYIATLFIVWQVINFAAFHTLPSLPTLVGGILIIAGGLIVTFWKPNLSN